MKSYFRKSFALNVISAIESTITTHSILGALVRENVTLYNISFNYMAKDVVSNIGSLIVINKLSKFTDTDPTKLMYFSQAAYQISIVAECLAGYLHTYMLIPTVGMAGIGKTISWTSIGAMNAKIIAKIDKDRIGENYARLTVVNTLANSIGTGIGLLIVHHPYYIITLPFLTMARIWILKLMLCKLN